MQNTDNRKANRQVTRKITYQQIDRKNIDNRQVNMYTDKNTDNRKANWQINISIICKQTDR